MSEGLNRVILLGNLGADPELKMTSGGQAVLKMRIATTETYLDRNKTKQEKTEWHSVTLWGKRAEALSKFLSKGSRLLVEGSLRTSSYDDRDGNKRYKTEVNAGNVVLCGQSRASGGTRSEDPEPDAAPLADGASGAGATDDDDIPFAPIPRWG